MMRIKMIQVHLEKTGSNRFKKFKKQVLKSESNQSQSGPDESGDKSEFLLSDWTFVQWCKQTRQDQKCWKNPEKYLSASVTSSINQSCERKRRFLFTCFILHARRKMTFLWQKSSSETHKQGGNNWLCAESNESVWWLCPELCCQSFIQQTHQMGNT